MVRAPSATARGIFSWGAPRRRGLWRPWPGEEKHLQLAQLQQDGGHPAGKVQAVFSPIHQPPAAGEALQLSYVSFSDTRLLSVVWFGWQQPQQPQLLRNFMISWFHRSLLVRFWPRSSPNHLYRPTPYIYLGSVGQKPKGRVCICGRAAQSCHQQPSLTIAL